MSARKFSTSAARACWMGDQRVASRVPRLASTITPPTGTISQAATTPSRSVSDSFSSLAGSTVTGRLRSVHASSAASRNVSTVRLLSTSPAQYDLKDQVKSKVFEEGKKVIQQNLNDPNMQENLKSAATKASATQASASLSKILFGCLAIAGAVYAVSEGTASTQSAPTASSPKYNQEQVSLLCLIGPHLSGKSSQSKRLLTQFPSEFDGTVSPTSVDELRSIVEERYQKNKGSKDNKQRTLSLIVENFPANIQDAEQVEAELVPIFCFSFYDLSEKEFVKRLSKDVNREEEIKKFHQISAKLDPVVHKYRERGNIYEISADWDSEDEVWEQVEAKTEQILELRERGDL